MAHDSHRYSNTGGSPDMQHAVKQGRTSPPVIVKDQSQPKSNRKSPKKVRDSDEYEQDDFEDTKP